MADLIIKPATGDGNKLILQDKAGGAVLTTADSGATIANATLTSPTLNSPTLVTPNLGTPSAITLTNATFPTGHMRFLGHSALTSIASGTVTSQTEMELVSLSTGTFTAGSKILLFGSGNVSQDSTSTGYYAYIFFNGVSASTGTASDTGLTSSFNNAFATEIGYAMTGWYSSDYAGTQLVTPTNGATECTYRIAYKTAQAQTDSTYFYRTRIALWEVYQ